MVVGGFAAAKPDGLRTMADKIRDKAPDCVVVLSTVANGKANVCIACGKDALARGLHAGKLIKETLATIGGSGGGRPDSAMGGTTEILRVDEAISHLPEIIKGMLK